jgi:hypothetical protein
MADRPRRSRPIAQAAADNEVDVTPLARAQIAALEPEVNADIGLLSPIYRHHRQPSVYAGAAGRSGTGARRQPCRRTAQRRSLAPDGAQWRRKNHAGNRHIGERRRLMGARRGPSHRGPDRYTAAVSGQGQLCRFVGPQPVPASGLSRARTGRIWACMSRWTWRDAARFGPDVEWLDADQPRGHRLHGRAGRAAEIRPADRALVAARCAPKC